MATIPAPECIFNWWMREPSVEESRRTLYGTIAALGCFELDPLRCVRAADAKVDMADAKLDWQEEMVRVADKEIVAALTKGG